MQIHRSFARAAQTSLAAGLVLVLSSIPVQGSTNPAVRLLTREDVMRFITAFNTRDAEKTGNAAKVATRAFEARLNLVRNAQEDAFDWVRDLAPQLRLPAGARYLPSCSRELVGARGTPGILATFGIAAEARDENQQATSKAVQFYKDAGFAVKEASGNRTLIAVGSAEVEVLSQMIQSCDVAPTGAALLVTVPSRVAGAANPAALADNEYKALTEEIKQAWNDWKNPQVLEALSARAASDDSLTEELITRRTNAELMQRYSPLLTPVMEKLLRPIVAVR